MLGGKMTNQDEDEVEEELAALELEIRRTQPLPNAPTTELPALERPEQQPANIKQKEPERQAMLA